MWISVGVILPLFWKAITCLVPGYSIRVTSSVSVQEGLCVTIPCKFTADSRNTFSNSSGYWIRRQEPLYPLYIVATNDKSSDVQKTNFHLTGNPDNGDCTLTITDAKKEDEGTYYYRFEESKVTNVKFHYSLYVITTITVTDLKEEPVISDPGIMVSGINKTCAPPWNCPVASLVFQWRKSNVAGIWKKNTSTVTFTMYTSDHQENIICEMTNSMEKTTRKNIFLFLRDVCICHRTTTNFTSIIVIVIANIAALVLIFVVSYFLLKKKMERKQLAKPSLDLGKQGTESTYEELKRPNNDIYCKFNIQK